VKEEKRADLKVGGAKHPSPIVVPLAPYVNHVVATNNSSVPPMLAPAHGFSRWPG
jgi:hypothetical protein